MNEILFSLPGVLCLIDNVLVFGSSHEQHDEHLEAVLRCIQSAGIALNQAKCEFGKDTIQFLGHVINAEGVSADPQKITAITKMKTPSSVSELRFFLEMTNQLGKFSLCIAEMSKPLRELLSKKSVWLWGTDQENAFQHIKQKLASNRILVWYVLSTETKISADASAYGIGASCCRKVMVIGNQ